MNIVNEYQLIREFLKNKISTYRILVCGDVMLDSYLYGDVSRISPEAPVPVSHITGRKEALGGAANVAHNLVRLGCKTDIIGVIGKDNYADKLHALLAELNIDDTALIVGRNKTTSKIRVISGHQQMMRLDFEETYPIDNELQNKLIRCLEYKINEGVNAIIISDYGKGLCVPELCQKVIALAHSKNILVFVDPKGNNWDKYAGADYITPNVKELGDVIGHKIENVTEQIQSAAKFIRQTYHIENVLVTRSEQGISLFSSLVPIHIPTVAQEVFDVSGAGDTVIAAFTAAITGKVDIYNSVYLSNFAAGIGVGKVGTYAVSKDEILQALKT